jgi:hypothetical protein
MVTVNYQTIYRLLFKRAIIVSVEIYLIQLFNKILINEILYFLKKA